MKVVSPMSIVYMKKYKKITFKSCLFIISIISTLITSFILIHHTVTVPPYTDVHFGLVSGYTLQPFLSFSIAYAISQILKIKSGIASQKLKKYLLVMCIIIDIMCMCFSIMYVMENVFFIYTPIHSIIAVYAINMYLMNSAKTYTLIMGMLTGVFVNSLYT